MKFLIKLILFIIILGLVAGSIFLFFFDINKYRGTITGKLSEAISRPVEIGQMSLKMSLIPTIKISHIFIGDETGLNTKNPFAKADDVELTIALPPLLSQELQIKNVAAKKIQLNINQETIDKNNDKAKGGKASSAPTASINSNPYLSQMKVDTVFVDLLEVNYQDKKEKQTVLLKDLQVRQLRAVSANITYKNINAHVSVTMDLMNLILGHNSLIFNANITVLGTQTRISANVGNLKNLKNILLNVDTKVSNLSDTLNQLGVSESLPLTEASFSAILKGDTDSVNIEAFKVSLQEGFDLNLKGSLKQLLSAPQGKMNGSIVIKNTPFIAQTGIKPMTINVASNIHKDYVDITKLSFTANKSDVESVFKITWKDGLIKVIGKVFSSYLEPQDLLAEPYQEDKAKDKKQGIQKQKSKEQSAELPLNKISAQIDWTLQNVKPFTDKDEYFGVIARTTLNDGILTANPVQIRTIAGPINAAVRVQNILSTPMVQVTFNGENVNLDKIKTLKSYLSGSTANLSGKVTTTGKNMAEMLSHLTGHVEFEATQGKIVNKWFNDLPETIKLVQKNKSFSYSQTDRENTLYCAAVNLNIQNGVIKMDKNIAVETSALNVVLSGQVNLPSQTMSLSMAPSLPSNANSNLLNAARLIKIEGPFQKPKITLDTKKVVQAGIDKGIEKGLDKLSEKMGLNIPLEELTTSVSEQVQPLSLCETALGHKLRGKVTVTLPKAPVKPTVQVKKEKEDKKEEQLSPEELLKKQLIQSLTSTAQ